MAWRNAFDIGACTLAIYRDDALLPPEEYAECEVSISVDESGMVTFVQPAYGSYDFSGSHTFFPVVVPSYPPNDALARIVGLTVDPPEIDYLSVGGVLRDAAEGYLYTDYSSVDPPAPEPLQLDPLPGYIVAGIQISEGSSG